MDTPRVLTKKELAAIMPRLSGWKLEDNKLRRTLEFRDFVDSLSFVNSLVAYFETVDHHPDVRIAYGEVTFELTRYDLGGRVTDLGYSRDSGAVALLSRLYPRDPIDISTHLEALPAGGTVPGLPDWQWIHTPGHTAGHVSLFRERDRTLLAGDAICTTKQESLLAIATQRHELHGPPAYFTQDWQSAAQSVQRLAALNPDVLASSHGEPMAGPVMRDDLQQLAATFERRELPAYGRYADRPAITDETGIVALPPDPLPKVLAGVAVAAGLAYAMSLTRRSRHAA
jgi:pterin-4a-carbinolamine dehydratase